MGLTIFGVMSVFFMPGLLMILALTRVTASEQSERRLPGGR